MHWVIGKYEKCTGRPLCVRYCPRGWINIRKLGNSTCLLSCLVPLEYVWEWKSLSPVLLFATPWTDLPGSSVHEILQAKILEQVSHSLFQGIFPTQGLNPGLLHCRWILYHLSHRQQLWWLRKEVKNQFRVVIMLAFLVAQMVKNLPANIRDPGSIPWDSLEKGMITPGFSPGFDPMRFLGKRNGNSRILTWGNPVVRGVRQSAVHGVTKSWTQLSNQYTHYPVKAGQGSLTNNLTCE